MAKEIKWSPDANETFRKTVAYVAENWSDREVGDFVRAAARVVEYLSRYPLMFRKSKKRDIHEAIVTPYNLLIYKIYADYIAVILIWDTRQNPENLVIEHE